jgi:DNA-binding protein HU-beta
MRKDKLIETLSNKVEGISKKQAEALLKVLTETIIEELRADHEVTITGFGTFSSRIRYARGGVNPQRPTERIRIPAVRVAKFKTGKRLKDSLKK